MIYLYINLPAYRQLKHLRKKALQKALEAIDGFIETTACESLFDDDGTWICSMRHEKSKPELERKKRDFAAAVLDLKSKIEEHERQLQGYSLFIATGKESLTRSLFGTLEHRMTRSIRDGELLITADALALLEGLFKAASVQGEISRVSGIGSAGNAAERLAADFLVRDGILVDFKREYESIWLTDDDARTMVILAEPGNGGADTVRYALDELFSGTEAFWITLRGEEARFGDAYPLAHSVSATQDHCTVLDYLSEPERELWTRQVRRLLGETGDLGRRFTSDCPEVDLFQILALQLAAYERCMEGQLLPPTWLCESYEQLPPSLREACIRFAGNSQSRSVMTVFLIHGETVPEELAPVPHTLLRIPRIETSEIAAKLPAFSTDTMPGGPAVQPAERFVELGVGSLRELYRLCCLSKRGEISKKAAAEPLRALLSAFDPETQKALVLLLWGALVLPEELRTVFFDQCDVGRESLHSARTAAAKLKLDIDVDPAEALIAARCLERDLGSAAQPLRRQLAGFLAAIRSTERIAVSLQAMEVIGSLEEPVLCADLVTEHVEALLESHNPVAALEVLRKAEHLRKDPVAAVRLQILKLKTSTLRNDPRQAAKELAELRKLGDTGNEKIDGQMYLEYARYHYAAGLIEEGLQDSKNALIKLQKYNAPQEKESYLFIGLHMLARARLHEAEGYLQIARDTTPKDNSALFILNGVYSAITQFMIGNLTRALSAVAEAATVAEESALHRYHGYLLFLEVRIQFELGCYERCIELCLDGLIHCSLYGRRPQEVFEKWLRRAEAFSGFPNEAAESLMRIAVDREARLFLAEAFCLAGRQDKALGCLEHEELDSRDRPKRFAPAEEMLWETGFSNLEDRAIPIREGTDVLSLLIRTMRAYLQNSLEITDVGLNALARIMKEEKLSAIDPHNGVYFYRYACAIGATAGEKDLDRLTALSKAFKYVQERAAMIDDSHDKQAYLHKNHVNSQILKEARQSNLM